MPILGSEIRGYRSAQVSDVAASNGGRLSVTAITSGVNNNVFPDVPQAERVAGSTKFRKVFMKNTNSGNLVLFNSRVFLENYTAGDDAVYMHAGTQTDVQSALTGSEKLYGCGKLDASVIAGAVSLTVLIESASVQFFQIGDLVRVSDRAVIDGAGNEEFVTLSNVSYAGSIATLTFTPALANGYAAANTRVSNVLSYGDLKPVVSGVVATTVGSGDFNHGASPITGHNIGSVQDTWTLTFTSSTAYTAAGAVTGAVGSGSTLADFSPTNPDTATPLFTVPSAGFTGAWASGDTLVFVTAPAAIPLWMKRVVPANAAAIAGNRAVIGIDGETA